MTEKKKNKKKNGITLEVELPEGIEASVDGRDIKWQFSELYPGDSGWLYLSVDLDEPDTPLRWYTNTVKITIPPGDVNSDDNLDEVVAFSGGEVRRVELQLNPDDTADIWGEAVSGPVTVTTPHDQYYAWADPDCDGHKYR